VIQEAIYGRRRAGRCTKAEGSDMAEDPRYLGCHADVLELLDAKCSGKKDCELRVPDPDLEQATPCVKSLKMFLEVRYTCVEGVCFHSAVTHGSTFVLSHEDAVFTATIITLYPDKYWPQNKMLQFYTKTSEILDMRTLK